MAFTILLSLLLLSVSAESPNCPNKDNCNAQDGHLVSIQCNSANPLCTCIPGTSLTGCEGLTELSTTQNAPGCQEFCLQKNISEKCVFYKFEEFVPVIGTKCFLMSENQCDSSSGQMCDPNHGCESGVADDSDCEPDPPLPSAYSCPLGEGEGSLSYDEYKIHWICTDGDNEKVDVYGKPAAPGGTVCRTDHRCSAFDEDQDGGDTLEYSCVLKEGSDQQPVGEWREENPKQSHDDAALSEGRLVEPSCNCSPLELNKESYTQEGLIVHCTGSPVQESSDITIPSPNNCLLLCDYYSVMHIFTDWQLDDNGFELGEQGWYYRLIGDPDDQEHNHLIEDTPTNITRCWI